MASLGLLKGYGSENDSSGSEEDDQQEKSDRATEDASYNYLKPVDPSKSIISSISVNAAPLVLYSTEKDDHKFIDDSTKELAYNPRFEDMYAPKMGPDNPFLTEHQKQPKNTVNGYVESTHVNQFQFENQRRTFMSYGYAVDPNGQQIIGDTEAATQNKELSSFEERNNKNKEKRKRAKNDDASDIEGYMGPWAKYENQVEVAKPNEEELKEIQEMLSKRKRPPRGVFAEQEDTSKSTMHIEDPVDYLGRSFLHIPQDLDKNLRSAEPPEKCYVPKRCIFTYTGHTKGVQRIKLFPVSGHLFLTCSLDCKVKLWEFYKERRCIQTYMGHSQGVRDISFNHNGTEFLSASFDRLIKLWDTQTGQCKGKFTTKKIPYCCVFHPSEEKSNLFVAGMADKKIICWDTRSGEIVQEYDRHLGAVNTITFVDNGKRIVTTSDDKSVRAWEWDIPVDFKYIADPSMHSMPSVTLSGDGKYLAFQSMDNQIKIMEPNANFRWKNKKTFKGHMVAGYACGIDFAPDMSYIISGDAHGQCVVWDWKTKRIMDKIKSHDQVCMDVKWHPHETSKILTCGWDNLIKLWD